jgi:hypothetical protein
LTGGGRDVCPDGSPAGEIVLGRFDIESAGRSVPAVLLLDVAPELGGVVGPPAVPGDLEWCPAVAAVVGGGDEPAAQPVAGGLEEQVGAGAGAGEQPGDRVGERAA